MNNKIKVIATIFLSTWLFFGIFDSLSVENSYFLLVGFFVAYFIPLIFLVILSLSLKDSEIKWQRVLGIIGICVVVFDLAINIIAFGWHFIR